MAKSTGKPQNREEDKTRRKRGTPPGKTIEARENQIISLVYDLVEERVKKKTATSQETTHFLKIGSVPAQLEKQKLKKEIELLEAKTETIKSNKRAEELFAEAMVAFKSYSGQEEEILDD